MCRLAPSCLKGSNHVHASPLHALNPTIKTAKVAKRGWRAALEAGFPFLQLKETPLGAIERPTFGWHFGTEVT
jgi:hypothetical protein